MLLLIEKVFISHNIRKNKDNIQYKHYQDINGLHEFKIDDIGISIQMRQNLYTENDFYLNIWTENYLRQQQETIGPKQQSLLDKIFIAKMYNKMLNYYSKKHGLQNTMRWR